MEKGLRRNTPIILRMALLAWVARRGTSVGGAKELVGAEAEPENSMTKQSGPAASSWSDFCGSRLERVDEEGVEEGGRGEGDCVHGGASSVSVLSTE